MTAPHAGSDPGHRSDAELAELVLRLARAADVDTVVCGSHDGELPRSLYALDPRVRTITATAHDATLEALRADGFEAFRFPVLRADKYRQARHVVAMAVRLGRLSAAGLVACALSHGATDGHGDLVVITDVEPASAEVALSEITHLADGVRTDVVRAAMRVACQISRVATRKQAGAILVLGDSEEVLRGARALIPNPFERTAESSRRLTGPEAQDVVVELAKLDGAFVVRGDGLIRTAGTLLAVSAGDVELPQGLGARHAAAAGITARTAATAIAVSATDGKVRVFKDGRMVLKTDAEVLVPFLE